MSTDTKHAAATLYCVQISDQAKAREERAAQAERDRVAAEAVQADRERAKREADAQHVERGRSKIVDALLSVTGGDIGPSAGDIADALLAGKIPHTRVAL